MAETQRPMDAVSERSNSPTPKLREDDARAVMDMTARADPGQSLRRARQASLPGDDALRLPEVPWHITPTISRGLVAKDSDGASSVDVGYNRAPSDAVVFVIPDSPLKPGATSCQQAPGQFQYTAKDHCVTALASPVMERDGTRSAPAHIRDVNGTEESMLLNPLPESPRGSQHDGYVALMSPTTESSHSLAPYGFAPPTYSTAVIQPVVADPNIQTRDGVFTNLAARPEVMVLPKPSDDPPPPYQTPVHLETRFYPGDTAFATEHSVRGGESGAFDEVVIDEFEVGSYAVFGIYFLVSALFEWVGFLMAYALSMSHAARHGSISGLGLTIAISSTHFHDFAISNAWWRDHSTWIAPVTFIIAFTGYVLLLVGLFVYHRMRIEAHDYLQSSGVVQPPDESGNRPVERRSSFFGNVYDNPYS